MREFLSFFGGIIAFVLVGTALILTVPDVYMSVNHMTPGTVRHVRHMSWNHEGYRVNPDGSVTFRDAMTDTWLTLPAEQVNLFPRNKWWWQRIAPPEVK